MSELSKENLIAAGYREHPVTPPKLADAFFQKRVRHETESRSTRYFINLFFYSFPDGMEKWSGELNTYLANGEYIDLGIHDCKDIEGTETFFEHAFTALNCRDYDDDF